MEDAVTEAPPPSRLINEDLDNFIKPSPSLPSPFLLFSNPNPSYLRPSLLVIGISSPSVHLFHQISSKTLVGTLILPEILLSGNSIEPSPKDKTCNVYAVNDDDDGKFILLVLIQFSIPPERSYDVAKLLIDGNQIQAEKVLILDSVKSQNFGGKLPLDETLGFKLETMKQKPVGWLVKKLDNFPSGSLIDGFAAAVLARCQLKRIHATLCVTWPPHGVSVISFLKSVILGDAFHNVDVVLESGSVKDFGTESGSNT